MTNKDLYRRLLRAANFWPARLEQPNAWVGHIPFAAWAITEIQPRVFVELGTHTGNSYLAMCQAVSQGGLQTRCYAVDTWEGDEHAAFYGEEVYGHLAPYHHQHYGSFSNLLRMTFDDALHYFEDRSIDLLHIDGLHTYEAVKHDFHSWLPKLAPGATVMFHDTNVRERDFGVWKLWEELETEYPDSFQFDHSHGLGVLHIPSDKRAWQLEELVSDGATTFEVKQYFASLGRLLNERYTREQQDIQLALNGPAVVQNKEHYIVELNQAHHEKDLYIAQLQQHTKELESRLAGQQDAITALNQICRDSEALLSRLEERLQGAERHNIALLQLSELQKHEDTQFSLIKNLLIAQNTAITQSVEELTSMRDSKSWRLTRPFRWTAEQLRILDRAIGSVPDTVRRNGGVKHSASRAIKVIRTKGLGVLVRRMMHGPGYATDGPSMTDARNNYIEWVKQYDTVEPTERTSILEAVARMVKPPLISVLMPTYNSDEQWLTNAIDSVRSQLYPHWELCIADDASTNSTTKALLERLAREEPRIKVSYRQHNGHISAASNTALEMASGEWVALLDHDDELAPTALYWVAEALERVPNSNLIYSDEDKIDGLGNRFDPYFKCDWNQELFYSHNLISHLGVYRTSLVRDLGGFRLGLEGAQDHDLALRYVELIDPSTIYHIPRILYHWRKHSNSTALSAGVKPYAHRSGERALKEHFTRQGIQADAEFLGHGYRVRYHLPETPLVSLIIPTRDGVNMLAQCIDSILTKTDYPNYEIIIIDNGSEDPATLQYLDLLRERAGIKIIQDNRPFNYSALNNAAVQEASGEIIGLINNDIEFTSSGWLSEMVSYALQPRVGAVGARLWYPNNTLQHAGVILGIGGVAGHAHKHLAMDKSGYFSRAQLAQGFSAVTAACLIIRKSIYQAVGGLNETDLKVAFNDIDFCLRVREAGYQNIWTPYADAYHYESATRGLEDTPEKQGRFSNEVNYMIRRWGDILKNDPAYSPNLTLEHEDFSYAWPPRVQQFPVRASAE